MLRFSKHIYRNVEKFKKISKMNIKKNVTKHNRNVKIVDDSNTRKKTKIVDSKFLNFIVVRKHRNETKRQ